MTTDKACFIYCRHEFADFITIWENVGGGGKCHERGDVKH